LRPAPLPLPLPLYIHTHFIGLSFNILFQ